jgi:hypothetical protein
MTASRPPRPIALYVGGAVLLLAGAVLIAGPLTRHVQQVGSGISATAAQLTAEPDSVPDAAVHQRFRRRREWVAAMRADLLKIVAAEARFAADSGHFSIYLPRPYWPDLAAGNALGAIVLTPHGWWTTITNVNVSIFCAVVVGPDTSIGNAPPGEPVCLGEHAEFPRGWPTTRDRCVNNGYRWDEARGVCRSTL